MPENELYVLSAGGTSDDAEDWVRPRPIGVAIAEAVTDETDLEEGDLDDLEAYVDRDEIAALLDDEDAGADETVSFTVEDHEVAVDGGGHIDVD